MYVRVTSSGWTLTVLRPSVLTTVPSRVYVTRQERSLYVVTVTRDGSEMIVVHGVMAYKNQWIVVYIQHSSVLLYSKVRNKNFISALASDMLGAL